MINESHFRNTEKNIRVNCTSLRNTLELKFCSIESLSLPFLRQVSEKLPEPTLGLFYASTDKIQTVLAK